jgi:general secretion pathway protein M
MPIRQWFDALAPRERLLVSAAGLLLVVAIVVIGGLRPLVVSSRSATAQLADRQAVLADIEHVAARFGPQAGAGASGAHPTGESLVVLVDRTTRSRGLGAYLKRNEPDGTDSIRLRFENVSFDELVAWLADLQATQAVNVVSASADPGQDAGRVGANLQLSRAPPRPAP